MTFYFSFSKEKVFEIFWEFFRLFIDPVLDFLNSKILKKYGFKNLQVVFDELDIFWLRNGPHKNYSESQVRLIISMFLKAAEDEHITRKELIALVDYVQRKWTKSEALNKVLIATDEVIEARVEATIDQAVELYEKTYEEKPQTPEEFIANTAEIILHEPDGSEAQALLGGMMQIRNKLIH